MADVAEEDMENRKRKQESRMTISKKSQTASQNDHFLVPNNLKGYRLHDLKAATRNLFWSENGLLLVEQGTDQWPVALVRNVTVKDTSNGKVTVIYSANDVISALKIPVVKDVEVLNFLHMR
nr:E3 ubiquitin-protein ligase UPL1-like [Tanacetum cinerariifolium]